MLPFPIEGAPIFFTDYPLPAILDQILPQPAYRLTARGDVVADVINLLGKSVAYGIEYFFPRDKEMQRWQLYSGGPRDFSTYFAELKDAYIEEIVIKDPWCGAGFRQIEALKQFVKIVNSQSKELKKISVQCKEQNFRDQNYISPDAIRTKMKTAIKEVVAIEPKINVIPFSYGKNFHDRSVVASTIKEDGVEIKHLYDLTGGIDYLMDSNRSTTIFYSQE